MATLRPTRTKRRTVLATSSLLIIGLAAAVDDEAPWARLRSLPGPQRRALAAKLAEFDALPPDEQARLRALDDRLRAMPDDEREGYLAVLRRFHLWMAGLPEAERAEVLDTPAESRLAAVSRIMAEQQTRAPALPLLILAADFGGYSPFELANRLRVWFALDPAQKGEVSRLEEPARSRRLQELGRALGVAPVASITPEQEEQGFRAATRSSFFPLLKRPEELVKLGRLRQRLAESAYFSEHPPPKVSPDNLLRFAEAMPVWMRSLIDPMSPEEARRRLTVLYRLVYPAPGEMPAAERPAPASNRPAAPPRVPPAGAPGPADAPF